MTALLTFPLALGLCSCSFEEHVSGHDYRIYFGTVKDMNTGTSLSTFCTNPEVERSKVIVFSAPAGSIVEEEVLFEWRQEKFPGSVPPQRDETFWCGTAPETYNRPVEYWICLQSTDSDPAATILAVERRGELGEKDSSSGYALKLQVRHPGVLHIAYSAKCLAERTNYTGTPVPWGELTIQ